MVSHIFDVSFDPCEPTSVITQRTTNSLATWMHAIREHLNASTSRNTGEKDPSMESSYVCLTCQVSRCDSSLQGFRIVHSWTLQTIFFKFWSVYMNNLHFPSILPTEIWILLKLEENWDAGNKVNRHIWVEYTYHIEMWYNCYQKSDKKLVFIIFFQESNISLGIILYHVLHARQNVFQLRNIMRYRFLTLEADALKKKQKNKFFSALETAQPAWNNMLVCLLIKAWIEAFLWLGGSKEGSGHFPCLWFLSNSSVKYIKLSDDIGIKHVSKTTAGGLSVRIAWKKLW